MDWRDELARAESKPVTSVADTKHACLMVVSRTAQRISWIANGELGMTDEGSDILWVTRASSALEAYLLDGDLPRFIAELDRACVAGLSTRPGGPGLRILN